MSDEAFQANRDKVRNALGHLLDAAIRGLVGLKEPVVVAACPRKHDDVGRYPDWLGVQVKRATWERSDYFVDGGSDVLENARNPYVLPAAKEVLAWLQSSGWHGLAERACGLRPGDEVIAVIVQHSVTWFVVDYTVFLLGPNGSLLQVGTLERLDHRLGRSRPLLLTRIEPAAWPDLHAAAPAFPAVRPEASTAAGALEAAILLAKLLHDAVLALRAVPGKLRYVAASDRNPDDDLGIIWLAWLPRSPPIAHSLNLHAENRWSERSKNTEGSSTQAFPQL